MKVLNLGCSEGHLFEGWFGSEEDFQTQVGRGLIGCPFCDDTAIEKRPSAPRLNVANLREAPAIQVTGAVDVQQRWMHTVKRMLANTEDVGERFPEEARRIHYGETPERGIRGRASAEDAQALREEGIEVVSVPVPPALKGPLQ
ncbi:MAG: DUF1178 family protein [Burkholderiaceae bacterium]